MEEIQALEQKIAKLNEKIALIMHRSIETQESIVESQARALRESKLVQSDETLDWKVSLIEEADHSQIFTPKRQRTSGKSSTSILNSGEASFRLKDHSGDVLLSILQRHRPRKPTVLNNSI